MNNSNDGGVKVNNDTSDEIISINNLLMDIESLEQLESKLMKFNVFETLGIVNTEIRHSNVLGWLLSPNENHGLGSSFLKKFVQTFFFHNESVLNNTTLNLQNVSLMEYGDYTVEREWRDIDILLVSKQNKLVIVIENKIWSKEANDQLNKYYTIINDDYVDYEKVFIYLTPEGELASDHENWVSFNYRFIFDILKNIIDMKKDYIQGDVLSFLNQYLDILGRYIVGENDLEALCKTIYAKHKKALDLIFEFKPDLYSEISNYLIEYLKEKDDLIVDDSIKSYVRFTSKNLDEAVPKAVKGWTKSNRILLYEFQNRNNKLVLKLVIGPGEQETREKLYDISTQNKKLFKGAYGTLSSQFTQIYKKEILSKNAFENEDYEERVKQIKRECDKFFEKDFKEIEEIITNQYE